jgi:hypothetical protein
MSIPLGLVQQLEVQQPQARPVTVDTLPSDGAVVAGPRSRARAQDRESVSRHAGRSLG